MTRIVLVACGKSKAASARPARELYTGNLFRAARAEAEARVARGEASAWFILSARHGLVEAGAVLQPYDQQLGADRAADERWGSRVVQQLLAALPGAALGLDVLAGAAYVAPLYAAIVGAGLDRRAAGAWHLHEPLQGLQVGERRAWFRRAREARSSQRKAAG